MTVIAFKDGVMAADTMLSEGNAHYRVKKLWRLPDGGVAGGAGAQRSAYAVMKFLADGGDVGGKDAPDAEDAVILIARPDGALWMIDGGFPAFPLLDKVAAIGCGADAARMAMSLGLSAVDAVSRVTRQDLLCGDPVQSMGVEMPVEFSGVQTHRQSRK